MEIEKTYRKTLYEHKNGSRILGFIKFSQISEAKGGRKINLMIIYSRLEILIYEISTIKKQDTNIIRPHFLIKKTLYGSLKSIVKLNHPKEKKPLFSVLFKSGRISTFSVDLEHNCLQIHAMHELNTKEVLSMERNAPINSNLEFSIQSDISSNFSFKNS